MTKEDDPILTTRDVAARLGVSVKTAQTWIEQGQVESWKTPGGHRRVRASAVDALREQLGNRRTAPVHAESSVALVVASEAALPSYVEAAAAAGLRAIGQSDPLNAMLDAGLAMPAVIAVELMRGDWERLSMCRRLLHSRDLAHMRMLLVTDMPAAQLEADLGALSRIAVLPAPLTSPLSPLRSSRVYRSRPRTMRTLRRIPSRRMKPRAYGRSSARDSSIRRAIPSSTRSCSSQRRRCACRSAS